MSNNNIIDDTEIQTAYNQNKDELLHSISFNGLETNPVMSSSLHLILLAKKISEDKECSEKAIEDFKREFINDILSISAKLSTLSKW